jgi:hypothetical protein
MADLEKKIFIADDDADILSILELMLQTKDILYTLLPMPMTFLIIRMTCRT